MSTQVLIELHAVCTRKLGMPRSDARAAVESISGFPSPTPIAASCCVPSRSPRVRGSISIFDAAIVCAAQRAGCRAILTEDLHDGQRFDDAVVENPFAG